jgi:hypothetical protein
MPEERKPPRPNPTVQPMKDGVDLGLRMTSAQGGIAWTRAGTSRIHWDWSRNRESQNSGCHRGPGED